MKNYDFYKYILDGVKDGVYFVDIDRKLTFWNQSAELITGFSADEVLGKHCYDNILNHIDEEGTQLCHNGCPLHKSLEDGQIRENLIYLHHKDGHRVPVTVHVMPIYEGDEVIGAVETFTDESEHSSFLKNMSELKVLAYQDQLTELPNRRYLENRLDKKLQSYHDLGMPFGIAIFDIDSFKIFNDSYGHDVGDEVLKMVSKIFKALTKNDEVIGRWGGEEFVGIFSIDTLDGLALILNRIRLLIENSGLRNDDAILQVTISAGGTLVHEADTIEDIIKRADKMLYESKENGRNRVTTE